MTTNNNTEERRSAMLQIEEGKEKKIRGELGTLIRKTLRIKKWGVAPHTVAYVGANENPYGYAYYTLELTESEAKALGAAILDRWYDSPVGMY
jgi:hypothetical protein